MSVQVAGGAGVVAVRAHLVAALVEPDEARARVRHGRVVLAVRGCRVGALDALEFVILAVEAGDVARLAQSRAVVEVPLVAQARFRAVSVGRQRAEHGRVARQAVGARRAAARLARVLARNAVHHTDVVEVVLARALAEPSRERSKAVSRRVHEARRARRVGCAADARSARVVAHLAHLRVCQVPELVIARALAVAVHDAHERALVWRCQARRALADARAVLARLARVVARCAYLVRAVVVVVVLAKAVFSSGVREECSKRGEHVGTREALAGARTAAREARVVARRADDVVVVVETGFARTRAVRGGQIVSLRQH